MSRVAGRWLDQATVGLWSRITPTPSFNPGARGEPAVLRLAILLAFAAHAAALLLDGLRAARSRR